MKLKQTAPAMPFTHSIANLLRWNNLGFRPGLIHPDYNTLFNKERKQMVPDQTAPLGVHVVSTLESSAKMFFSLDKYK